MLAAVASAAAAGALPPGTKQAELAVDYPWMLDFTMKNAIEPSKIAETHQRIVIQKI